MGRPRQLIFDGMKWCPYHGEAHPIGDFDRKRVSDHGAVVQYHTNCRVARQTISDIKIAADPALASIKGRAARKAGEFGKALGTTISTDWVLIELNWIAFVPLLRALISPGGMCLNCAKHWDDASKYELDHRYPEVTLTDWSLQHSRNLWLICPGCNNKKGPRDGDREWMETQHRDWMTVRRWADHAGEKGWPPPSTYFGEPTELVMVDTAHCDALGTGTLFDADAFTRLGPS